MKKVLLRLRQSPIIKQILSLFLLLPLVFSFGLTAFATPAVSTPVSGSNIGGLLVGLGLMSQSEESGLFDWRTDTKLGERFYTTDIFGNVVPKIKSGESCSNEDLAPLLGTVIPDGVYSQSSDGLYLINDKPVTSSDILLQASSLVGVTYGLPVNLYSINDYKPSSNGVKHGWYSPVGSSDVNNGNCFIPIYGYQGGLLYSKFGLALFPSRSSLYDFSGVTLSQNASTGGTGIPNFLSTGYDGSAGFYLGIGEPSLDGRYRVSTTAYGGAEVFNVLDKSFNRASIWSDIEFATFAVTKGLPVDTVVADEKKLEGAVVRVEINNFNPVPPDGGGQNDPDKTVVVPVPPVWEIWKSIADAIQEISDGTDTNNGTTFGDFVNNNYNYNVVDVDVNVPDNINVGLSGGLDINGKGDINVNIHESLPAVSSGDGSSFFDANVVDVLSALTVDNPVASVIKGIFTSIDPYLFAVFSTGVSLMIVLGLWKMIRG